MHTNLKTSSRTYQMADSLTSKGTGNHIQMEKTLSVLWITNLFMPELSEHMNALREHSGGWVHSAANAVREYDQTLCLSIAAPYNGNTLKTIELDGIKYFLVPQKKSLGANKQQRIANWRKIYADVKPDVTHIHGTEKPHSLEYIEACGSKNVVVSIQGLVSVCQRYYYGGLSLKDILVNITMRDLARFDTLVHQRNKMKRQGETEQKIIGSVSHIIGRTDWDRAHCEFLNPGVKYHFGNETMRSIFFRNQWKLEECEQHSLFLSQGHYPLKGLHNVIAALPMILARYPDTKLYISGSSIRPEKRITRNGYEKIIARLIRRHNLESKIIYLGSLSEEEMCKRFLKTHVFISASIIENSSNSICEAQLLGVPCVASNVGGTSSIINHQSTGLLYRYEEVEELAFRINTLFANPELAQFISTNSRSVASSRHDKEANARTLLQTYHTICKQS